MAVAFVSFTVWMANQPSEFDEFIMASRKFTDDLYSGNLLPDRSQNSRDNIDKVNIPDLDDLMKDSEENPFPDDPTEEELVDKFMDEKFFNDKDGDELGEKDVDDADVQYDAEDGKEGD
jgi:translocation protein SEC62